MTPEELGNFTYGYIERALGLSRAGLQPALDLATQKLFKYNHKYHLKSDYKLLQ